MNTSYFAKSGENPLAVSIARRSPNYFTGRDYLPLAPPEFLFRKVMLDEDERFFRQHYQAEVLEKLNPIEVVQDLGDDSILLCWEKPGKFCHRVLVAEWLKQELGIRITEL